MTAEYKSRKVGLVIFGVIQILIGAMCAMAILLIMLSMVMGRTANAPGAEMSLRMMIPSLGFYAGAAVWFVWLGIGSIMTRRWARALTLAASWIVLLCGLGGVVFWIFFSPQFYRQLSANGDVPQRVITVIRYVTTFILAMMYVVGPGAFVLFYRSRHVKDTVDALDVKPRWTDRCPLPVLAMAMLFAGWAVGLLSMGSYRFALPFFGVLLSGVKGAAVCLVLIVASAWTAVGLYRLKLSAWWTGLALLVAFYASAALTFSRVSMLDYYAAMDFPPAQMAAMEQFQLSGGLLYIPMLVGAVAFFGFMLYVRRFFACGQAE